MHFHSFVFHNASVFFPSKLFLSHFHRHLFCENNLISGFGYGLPISRLYARYFHGDITLISCEGYGTDTVIYMKVKNFFSNFPLILKIFSLPSACRMKRTSYCQFSTRRVHDFTGQPCRLEIGQIR